MDQGSKFTVTLTSVVPSAECEIRKLLLKSVREINNLIISVVKYLFCNLQTSDPEKELTVTHMHYTAWPDHGLPQNAMSLISFIRRVHKEHPVSLDQPLLVHCSAGVGRTGTFILLDRVMQQMKREGTLSIYNILKGMRGQRMKMVQTQVDLLHTIEFYCIAFTFDILLFTI